MNFVTLTTEEPPASGSATAEPPSPARIPDPEPPAALIPVDAFRARYFPEASAKDWESWRWQLKNRITSPQRMASILGRELPAKNLSSSAFPAAVTPYYMSVALGSPAVQQSIFPDIREADIQPFEMSDPLGEEGHSPVPGIVHRYPDRALFLVTEFCSTYCRYCTRSRLVGKTGHCSDKKSWEAALDYIRSQPKIRDVLLSGGDPLTLPDLKIEWILAQLRRIPHVEIIRIGTKVPAVLPQRITPILVQMLRRYHPLFMSLHFCHPDELTPETTKACRRLADAGIPLGSQTVLLAGINDNVPTMTALMQGLLRNRVRPYYLYQCDPIPGSTHFRTSVEKGLSIIEGLRGHTSGYCIPTYVIDAPGGGGKVPLQPQYVLGQDAQGVILRNYEQRIFHYPDGLRGKEA